MILFLININEMCIWKMATDLNLFKMEYINVQINMIFVIKINLKIIFFFLILKIIIKKIKYRKINRN